jgi:hypothetical protein
MKTAITTALLVVALLADFSEGAAFINNGTYIEDWEETCAEVIAANEFYGSCCAFSDIDEGGKACRLTVAGEGSGCGRHNKKYLEDCAKAGGCLAGPYVSVEYAIYNITPVPECPPTQYEWNVTSTNTSDSTVDASTSDFPKLYNVTYVATDACPNGSIEVKVMDDTGKPIVGKPLSVLLVDSVNNKQYSGAPVTDDNGMAVFDFSADATDAGATIWCSIAVSHPEFAIGLSQQVPCSVDVCDKTPDDEISQKVDDDSSGRLPSSIGWFGLVLIPLFNVLF